MRRIVVLGLLAACSHHAATSDALLSGDAPAAHDGPAGTAGVGSPCTKDSDCPIDVFGANQGICIQQAPFTGGYCSARIGECPAPGATNSPCPVGSACISPGISQTGGTDFCLKDCATGSDCRVDQGYACCPAIAQQTASVCYPIALCHF